MNKEIWDLLVNSAKHIPETENLNYTEIENSGDFIRQKGKLYFITSENALYKENNGSYTRFKRKEGNNQEDEEVQPEWTKKLKEDIDKRLKKMEDKQKEWINTMNENIRLKFIKMEKDLEKKLNK